MRSFIAKRRDSEGEFEEPDARKTFVSKQEVTLEQRSRSGVLRWLFLITIAVFCACTQQQSRDDESVRSTRLAAEGTSVTTNSHAYGNGAAVTVNWAGFTSNALDWVSVALANSPDTDYVQWVYTAGALSGSTVFNGLPAGTYVARGYYDDSYVLETSSSPFTVGFPIRTDKAEYNAGEPVVVTYSGMAGNATDWIGIARQGSPADLSVQSQYTGGQISGTKTFNALPVGAYVGRSFFNNSSVVQHETAPFQIGVAGELNITSDKQGYTAAETVHATYVGAPGNATDWVGLAVAGSPNTSYISYQYTGGGSSGVKHFSLAGLANGSYVVRLFEKDDYALLSQSATFAIGPVTETGADNEGASRTAVAPKWLSTLTGTYSGTESLVASIRNRLAVNAAVSVDLRAAGLGGHLVVRRLFDGTVLADSALPITVTVGDIPLQGPEEAVQAELVVTVNSPADYAGVVVPSRPIHLRATSATYANFQLYGESWPATPILSNPTTFEQAAAQIHGGLNAFASPAVGRFYNAPTAEWRALNTRPLPGDELHSRGSFLELTPTDSNVVRSLYAPFAALADSQFAPIRVCGKWPAEFIDDLIGTGSKPYWASFAYASLTSQAPSGVISLKWAGTLDASGCTDELTLQNNSPYVLDVLTTLEWKRFGTGRRVLIERRNVNPAVLATSVLATHFRTKTVLQLPSAGPVRVNVDLGPAAGISGGDVTRVAAVISRSLERHGVGIPPGDYEIHVNDPSETCTACTVNGIVTIRPNTDTPRTHNSQYKFIVAHEFGHAVHFKGWGRPPVRYDLSTSGTDASLCGCAHVDDPLALDRSHCLQSKNSLAIAEYEGAAHSFAATVWGGDNPSNCTFVYYKNFKDSAGNIHRPPFPVSCAAPVKWLENRCAEAARGVEWDWMNFERALAVATAPTKLADLIDVYKRACGNVPCLNEEKNFQQLLEAAKIKYGPLHVRSNTFLNTGLSYGVNF